MPFAAGRNSSRSRPLESSERSKLTLKNSLLDTWKIDSNVLIRWLFRRDLFATIALTLAIKSRVEESGSQLRITLHEFETRILENTRKFDGKFDSDASKNWRNSSTLYNDCNRDVPCKFEFLMKRKEFLVRRIFRRKIHRKFFHEFSKIYSIKFHALNRLIISRGSF